MRENRRLIKINEEIKKEMNSIISFRLKNPNVTGIVSVTKVVTTADLKYSTVYVSMLNKTSEEKIKTLEALKKSKGYIRSEIARTINLRVTPEFTFKEDDSLEYAQHMEEIFKNIRNDENSKNE